MPGCLIFEDEHLLVANKPAGMNTHAPSPFSGEGLYDWLRHREPRWAGLAIVHRLDKDTSGVMVLTKTPLASRSLTDQFTRRLVHKKYLFLTDRQTRQPQFAVKTCLVRAGERYVSRPVHAGAEIAETRFRLRPASGDTPTHGLPGAPGSNLVCWEAEPLTGRTHQIRVHAAESGLAILGDSLYGGSRAERVYLHAAEIRFAHPETGKPCVFTAPFDTAENPRWRLRAAILEEAETDATRLIHGASDGWPGLYVERLGDYLLSQGPQRLSPEQGRVLERLSAALPARGVYHKVLSRQVRRTRLEEASPQLIQGQGAPQQFTIRENGLRFELSFQEGYSVGLFLDQRDNRRRCLTGHIAAGFALPGAGLTVLNTFAYTCGFSVGAAKAGARTTSLDLSRKYLDWGRRNFALNGLESSAHDFIYGDVFDWLQRFARKGRSFDLVLLDPPTFSQSRESGVFRAVRDYGRLVAAALPLVKPSGVLFASTNAAEWPPEEFLDAVTHSIRQANRSVLQRHYSPQPPDFPVSKNEPAHLKTAWFRLD